MKIQKLQEERKRILKKSKQYSGDKLHRAAVRLGEIRTELLCLGIIDKYERGE